MKDKRIILEKIRKILSKTRDRGCSEAEAETALAVATRLMKQYNIELHEVNVSIDEIDYSEVNIFRSRFEGSIWERNLIGLIAEHNLCKTTITKVGGPKCPGGMISKVYGKEIDRTIVIESFKYMRDFYRRLYPIRYTEWKETTIRSWGTKFGPEFVKNHFTQLEFEKVVPTRTKWINSYLLGVCKGVADRLKRDHVENIDSTEYGLVKVAHDKVINEYIENLHPDIQETKSKPLQIYGEAFMQGVKDGKLDSQTKMIKS